MGYIVYKAVNNLNGHFYIGVTKLLLRKRAALHRSNAKRKQNTKIAIALMQYGTENFSFHELYSFDSQRDAWDMEIMMISDLNPHYNTDVGGPGGRGNLGKKHPPERIKKMSRAHKAAWAKRPTKEIHPAFLAGKNRYIKDVLSKPVRLVNDGRIFKSGRAAAQALGVAESSVCTVIHGGRKSVRGLIFERVEN